MRHAVLNVQPRTRWERASPAFGGSVLLALLLVTAPYRSAAAITGGPSDETPAAQRLECSTEQASHSAIHAVWSEVDAAWNARDANGFSHLFADDARFTFVQRGQSFDGRAEILEHFSKQFPRLSPDLRHRTRIATVQAIAPDVFAASGNVEIQRVAAAAEEAPAVLRTFAIFAVMTAQDEDWSIRALRVYQLPPPSDDAD